MQAQAGLDRQSDLSQANRNLRTLSACNQVLVRAKTEEELLNGMCRNIVEIGNHQMAWIGFAESDPEQTIRPVASWGGHEEYLRETRFSWGFNDWGRGPAGRAFRGRQVMTDHNLADVSGFDPWRENARKHGFASSIVFPLTDEEEKTFGVLCIFSGRTYAFTAPDVEILRELMDDLSFGLRALRRSAENRNLVRAVEQSASGVVITDLDGVFEYVNPAFTRLTGYTLADVQGQTHRVLKSGKQPPELYEKLWSTILSGNSFQTEVINRKKDGSEYTASINIAPVTDERGRITHFIGVQEDISEIVESQRQLERYTTRLRRLLQVERDISSSLEPAEVFRHIVDAAAELFGLDYVVLFTAEDGRLTYRADHGGWLAFRGSAELVPGAGSYVVLETGKPLQIEDIRQVHAWSNLGWPAKEGIKGYVGVPLKREETVVGVLSGLCRDVRKFPEEDMELLALLANHAADAIWKAQLHQEAAKGLEFLRSALDASPNAIHISDVQNHTLFWNASAEKLFGFTGGEVSGENLLNIAPEDMKAGMASGIARLLRGETVDYETRRRRKDGSVFPVRIIGAPVRDAGGNVVARTVVFEDLTERKRVEQERETYIVRMKALNSLNARISASLDLDEVFAQVVRAAAELLALDMVVLFTNEGGKLTYRADHGGWREARGSVEVTPGSLTERAFRTGEPTYSEDMGQISGWKPLPFVAEQGLRSYLGIPLTQVKNGIGVLVALCRGIRRFSEDEVELFSLLANNAAEAIEKARLHGEVSKALEFFRSVVASSPDAVLTLDDQSRILSWSQAAEAMFGYTSREAIGKTTDETILPESDKADRDAMVAQVFAGEPRRRETSRRRKDGTLVPVRLTAAPVRDTAGNVIARVAVFEDLTERRAAEREREAFIGRLKALNGLISQVSSSLDIEEVLVSVAQSAEELLNLSDVVIFLVEGDELIPKADVGGWRESTGITHLSVQGTPTGSILQRGEPLYIRDVLAEPGYISKEWAQKRGVGSYLGIPMKAGKTTIGVLRLLTIGVRGFTQEEVDLAMALASGAATAVANAQAHAQLQDAFQKLQQSQTLLIRAEKLSSIGTLTAGAAHEILNPANIIGLHAQRLAWENDEGSGPHQSAQVILRNVERISRICEDLRRFSRDESSVRDERFNPDDALRQCIRPLEPEFRLASVDVSYQLAERAPDVLGDKNQIQQVYFNILRNAMDAMTEGGTLTLSSREVIDDSGKWWETKISDTGTGIPAEVLLRIFDPFFTTKSEDKGTGLGLSVSYGIVESHGGRIWAENNPDKGAAFYVRLPIQEEKADE